MLEQEKNKQLQAKVAELEANVKKLEAEVERLSKSRGKINQEMVGLKGDMLNVAFVIDASGSMLENNRWEFSHRVLNTWMQHLEVEKCVVIAFSADVQIFPPDGELLELQGMKGEENRKRMLEFLKTIKPNGGTNTRSALRKAYSISSIDTIVLFTDGAPNNGKTANFDPAEATEIYKLVEANKKLPINAVGLGNYFKGETSDFLMKIKELSNGTFLGR
jgi:Mg-chelatase subunit ChlD